MEHDLCKPIQGACSGWRINEICGRCCWVGTCALLAAGGRRASASASAQDAANFPNKPIRVIVPFAAGGGNDIFARLVGQKAGEILGQTFVIENKPGAGGRIAAEYVMNQPRDGYTLFVGASGVMSIAAAAYPNLPYHPTKSSFRCR